jgi:tetratricopeptide (TPR) repeat protein
MTGRKAPDRLVVPGRYAVSNIPIRVPTLFMGRDDALEAIEAALKRYEGRVAITALHGLRGVGKTTLAAAYAERHRSDYRATWWIRAQTPETMRADLVALGMRLRWVAADEKEEPALTAVMERLRQEGEGILLIYDNAIDANTLKPSLPPGGGAQVLVTSNAHAWRGVAAPVEILLWPKEIGADYLMARTGRAAEHDAALALSEALGGLPLAHEQAAAYCERLDISLAEYARRFEGAPGKFLDDARNAPTEYHDGLTVAKTFALAIDEAAKLHPAAEPLIVHAALLAPEPIPLFLFSEAREKFGEPLSSALVEDGLDEAVAALRTFALLDRETIVDERDPSMITGCIRLHRLVSEVASSRRESAARDTMRRALINALSAVFPAAVWRDPDTWPRVRRLDAHALALVCNAAALSPESLTSDLLILSAAGQYRQHVLAAYGEAKALFEQGVATAEQMLGSEHPDTATSLNNLARLLHDQGDLAGARPLLERALAINAKALGAEHRRTANSLNNLAFLLKDQNDLSGARPLYERALAIYEKVLGPEDAATATSLNNLARLLHKMGDLAAAQPLCERALAIRQKVLGPEHPDTSNSLNSLATLLHDIGDLEGARPLHERALAIREKVFGPEHPVTGESLHNLAVLLKNQGDFAKARPLFDRALAIAQKVLGPDHRDTATALNNLALLLRDEGDLVAARPLSERALAIYEKVVGPEHPLTAFGLNSLAVLLKQQGDLLAARPLFERAVTICEKVLGSEHPHTAESISNLANLLREQGHLAEAQPLFERALRIRKNVLGLGHPSTRGSARVTADALDALGRSEEAATVREKYGLQATTH